MTQKRKWRSSRRKKQSISHSLQNKEQLKSWFENALSDDSFADMITHGDVKWKPANLAAQALVWAWQETRNITDAFDYAVEVCRELELDQCANTYSAFMNALATYRDQFTRCLNFGFQQMAQKIGRSFFTDGDFVLVAYYHAFRRNVDDDPTGYKALQAILGVGDMAAFQKEWEAYAAKLVYLQRRSGCAGL